MHRRSFLRTSALAGFSSVSAGTLLTKSAFSQEPSLDPNTLAAATAAHVTATANVYGGVAQGVDWKNMSNGALAVYQNMVATGFDSKIIPIAKQITADQLDFGSLDSSGLLKSIQTYQPSFQVSDLNQLFALVHTDSASLAAALTKIQQNGFSMYAQQTASRFNRICTLINDSANQSSNGFSPTQQAHLALFSKHNLKSSQISNGLYTHTEGSELLRKAVWQRIAQTSPSDGGGGGYNCQADAAAGLALGTIFAVLAIMAGPAGALAGGALLDSTILWGGSGAAAWGLGHAVFCGF